MELQAGDTIFQTWKIKNVIGKGSFGTVYEIERNEFGHIYHAAAKVIQISKERFYSDDMLGEETTEENYIEYYRSLVEDVVEECALMERMKGDSHIVSYEDHQIEQKKDGSWIIYIRMELLKPLRTYMTSKKFTNRDVIQLGIDLCMGLESCQKFNIIHRDIKPENIFVSETGSFKLGDFGISKALSSSEIAMSKKGTQLYMAPEVYRGEQYNSTVDIYSLGLVLFRLMNDNRLPFFPLAPQPIRYRDNEIALQKRLSGIDVPAPCNALGRLGEIIQKACKYEPAKRYGSPREMRRDLEAILYDSTEQKNIYPNGEDVLNQRAFMTTSSEKEIEDESDGTVGVFIYKSNAEKKIEEEAKKEEQQRQEEERKRKELQKEEKRADKEEERNGESDEEKDKKSEIDKLIEQKKIDLEIKERALRQQQRFQRKSDEDVDKEIMIKQIEEKRIEEEKKKRKNRIIATIILAMLFIVFIIIKIVIVIGKEHKSVQDSAVSGVVSSYIDENHATDISSFDSEEEVAEDITTKVMEEISSEIEEKDYDVADKYKDRSFSDNPARAGSYYDGYITLPDSYEFWASFNPDAGDDNYIYIRDNEDGVNIAAVAMTHGAVDIAELWMQTLDREGKYTNFEVDPLMQYEVDLTDWNGLLNAESVSGYLCNLLYSAREDYETFLVNEIELEELSLNGYSGYTLGWHIIKECSDGIDEDYDLMYVIDDPRLKQVVHCIGVEWDACDDSEYKKLVDSMNTFSLEE